MYYYYSTGIEESRWTGGANSGQTIRFREKTSISCVCRSMGLWTISFSKFNSQRQRNLGSWKKVVHPPSTTFPPLRFVNNFWVLYIDFWPKYFQLPTILLSNIFRCWFTADSIMVWYGKVWYYHHQLRMKIFETKVYMKSLKIIDKSQWRKGLTLHQV